MKNVFKKITLSVIVILTLLSTTESSAQSGFKLATNYEQYVNLYKNPKVKIARTAEQFSQMAKTNSKLKAIFDTKTLKAFMSSLKMSGNGLVTFSYDSIKTKFPENYKAQVDIVLAAFGFGPIDSLPVDYDGYYCESAGTCSKRIGSICIGDNC
ncbi:MAG: hypothetical protein SFU99_16970 [Saprospiraceae bacterium]|nr:hypothetical protein [Saprospiraceae bacterium]